MSARHAHRIPYGAHWRGDGSAEFRIWAPSQRSIALEIGGRRLPMQRTDDGSFTLLASCAPGDGYRYRLDDGLAVPDPASRAQAGDVHDESLVVDPRAYEWRHDGWHGRPWCETVLYELHVGACGGYEGVMAQLPRLAALGVTAVELMPIGDFPGTRNWGYDAVLPYAPDRAYGPPEALKALVDAAHGLGLMVFLDVIYNHFGPDGNYLHAYAPEFFVPVPTVWGAAPDFARPQVRAYFMHNALYWLQEYRFDGLRFDAVHTIPDSGWLDETAAAIRAAVEPGRHVHLVLENDANVAAHLQCGYDAQWNDDGHHALHVLLTDESEGYYANFAEAPAQRLARCLAEGFVYQGEYSPSHGAPRGTPSAHLPPHAFVLFLQNHDQIGNRALGERLITLAHPDALRAAVALQLLAPQIPLLFMGEEWACRAPFLYFTDHHDALAEAVREGRRREFAHFASFADPARRERIPDPNALSTYRDSVPDFADAARPVGAAHVEEYRELLALRHAQIVPGLAQARSLGAEAIGVRAVVARWRLGGGRVLSIAANFDGAPVAFVAPAEGQLIHVTRAVFRADAGELPAYCTAVFLESVP